MIWWLNQPNRALTEKAEIAALADRAPWLSAVKWSSDFPALTVEFDLLVDGKPIALKLIYDQLFPQFPARIVAKDQTLITSHQYGPQGELCLEWRSDNWHADITGAMLIESAYRLLSTEKEAGKPVASAHAQTIGQEVRKTLARFLLPENTKLALLALPEACRNEATLVEHRFGGTWIAELTSLGKEESPDWEASALFTAGRLKCRALVLREPVPTGAVDRAWLESAVGGEAFSAYIKVSPQPYFIIADGSDVLLCQLLGPPEKLFVYPYRTIDMPQAEARLEASHATLSGKLIGIIGCGSVGSKIARSLARSGIGHFTLVDSDIVFPGNLVRNELDLRSVGVNKTAALKEALLEINSGVGVETHDILLGRQESSAWTAATALKLSKCDVLIDATADISAFSVVSAIAQANSKPMIWGRVYEGGLGGLVARARPGADPVPQAARRQIDGWFQQKGVPWKASVETRSYGSVVEGAPIVPSRQRLLDLGIESQRVLVADFPGIRVANGLCPIGIVIDPAPDNRRDGGAVGLGKLQARDVVAPFVLFSLRQHLRSRDRHVLFDQILVPVVGAGIIDRHRDPGVARVLGVALLLRHHVPGDVILSLLHPLLCRSIEQSPGIHAQRSADFVLQRLQPVEGALPVVDCGLSTEGEIALLWVEERFASSICQLGVGGLCVSLGLARHDVDGDIRGGVRSSFQRGARGLNVPRLTDGLHRVPERLHWRVARDRDVRHWPGLDGRQGIGADDGHA